MTRNFTTKLSAAVAISIVFAAVGTCGQRCTSLRRPIGEPQRHDQAEEVFLLDLADVSQVHEHFYGMRKIRQRIAPLTVLLVMQLGRPPSGYRYVRVAGDILMIAIGTSLVVDAIQDLGR